MKARSDVFSAEDLDRMAARMALFQEHVRIFVNLTNDEGHLISSSRTLSKIQKVAVPLRALQEYLDKLAKTSNNAA